MSAHVIGVVRSAACLELLVHTTRGDGDAQKPWQLEHVCELRALDPGSPLWASWRALAAVTAWDATTLDHVLAILRDTVPLADGGGNLPVLGGHAPAPPRAAAAHPRAYRGTKLRPARVPIRTIDLRPYLLARRHVDQVLELLGQPRGIDPYVAWHHRVDDTAGFEPAFVTHVMPLLRDAAWSEVCAFATAARALELEHDRALRAALIGVIIAARDPTRALAWWHHVLGHEPARRLELAQLVHASGITAIDPIDPGFAEELATRTLEQRWRCYRALAAGATPAYLRAGFALDAIGPLRIDDLPAGRDDVAAIVDATVVRLGEAMREDSGAAFWRGELWWLLGMEPRLVPLLAHPAFSALTPGAAFWMLRLAHGPRWAPKARAALEWDALVPSLPILADSAARLDPPYQRKYVEDLARFYWIRGDDLDTSPALREVLARGVALARVARPPFGTDSVLGQIAHRLLLPHAHRLAALCEASDASWLALERACERENEARLIGRGIGSFAVEDPALLVAAFTYVPTALIATAGVLGCLSPEQRAELLAAYRTLPIADPALRDASIERLREVIDPIARESAHAGATARVCGPNPIRRALRKHLEGTHVLTEVQLCNHRMRIVAELDAVRMAAIRHSAERALAARAGIERAPNEAAQHALAMLSEVDVHRRQLRRLVTAYLAGDRDWRVRHPRSQTWLAKHPKLASSWLAGFEIRATLEELGDVTLAIETDPLEALRLGTYVGSCIGRGGAMAYSAAAVALDVNKHVVYARDARGSVIGRQLLAMSEAEQLVCFHVYGSAKRGLLEPLFRELDRAFAARLGVSIYKCTDDPDEAHYEIEHILSRDFWDDTAWDAEASR